MQSSGTAVAVSVLLGLVACGGTSSSTNATVPVTTTQSAASATSATTVAPDRLDVPIGQAQSPPHIRAGVAYRASLLRPLILVTVASDDWGAQQYANKPVYNADFVLHPELGDNPDGVISFIGGLDAASPTSPSLWIDDERGLANQIVEPRTSGTIAGGVPTVEYEADIVGGPFVSVPEFDVPAGWRIHLVAVTVDGKTMGIAYAAPKSKFAAFAPVASKVLTDMHFIDPAAG